MKFHCYFFIPKIRFHSKKIQHYKNNIHENYFRQFATAQMAMVVMVVVLLLLLLVLFFILLIVLSAYFFSYFQIYSFFFCYNAQCSLFILSLSVFIFLSFLNDLSNSPCQLAPFSKHIFYRQWNKNNIILLFWINFRNENGIFSFSFFLSKDKYFLFVVLWYSVFGIFRNRSAFDWVDHVHTHTRVLTHAYIYFGRILCRL